MISQCVTVRDPAFGLSFLIDEPINVKKARSLLFYFFRGVQRSGSGCGGVENLALASAAETKFHLNSIWFLKSVSGIEEQNSHSS